MINRSNFSFFFAQRYFLSTLVLKFLTVKKGHHKSTGVTNQISWGHHASNVLPYFFSKYLPVWLIFWNVPCGINSLNRPLASLEMSNGYNRVVLTQLLKDKMVNNMKSKYWTVSVSKLLSTKKKDKLLEWYQGKNACDFLPSFFLPQKLSCFLQHIRNQF